MDERSKWIEYKGKKLFHMDLSGLDEKNQLEVLEFSTEKWINSSRRSSVAVALSDEQAEDQIVEETEYSVGDL